MKSWLTLLSLCLLIAGCDGAADRPDEHAANAPPDNGAEPGATIWVSLEELKTDVETCLRYEGDEHSGPRFTAARREKLEQELLPAFWRALAELISFEAAELHVRLIDLVDALGARQPARVAMLRRSCAARRYR